MADEYAVTKKMHMHILVMYSPDWQFMFFKGALELSFVISGLWLFMILFRIIPANQCDADKECGRRTK